VATIPEPKTSADRYVLPPSDMAVSIAAAEVYRLMDKLEPALDPQQRRLMHQLRLAAEELGAIRATSRLRYRS
jgi:hypothetical protein